MDWNVLGAVITGLLAIDWIVDAEVGRRQDSLRLTNFRVFMALFFAVICAMNITKILSR